VERGEATLEVVDGQPRRSVRVLQLLIRDVKVGRCRLTPDWPRVDRAWSPRLKLKRDEPLSSSAFNVEATLCSSLPLVDRCTTTLGRYRNVC